MRTELRERDRVPTGPPPATRSPGPASDPAATSAARYAPTSRHRDAMAAVLAGVLVLAATVGFDRVFADAGWLPLAWSAVALALAVAAAARLLRFGPVAALLASAVAWSVFVYVSQLEATGLLPGSAQVREFLATAAAGAEAVTHEPTPARTLPGLLLLVSTGCWWMTHLVHEVLARARKPGMAVCLAAALWMFPLAPPQPPGRTWTHAVPFLAAAGLVLLTEPAPELDGSRRAGGGPVALRAGSVVGGVALLLAVAFPSLLPGYGSEAIVDLTGPDAARGYQPIVDVSQRLKLPEPRDLLRVSADRPLYLRLAGLETFDGNVWRLGAAGSASFAPDDVVAADGPLPPETEIARFEEVGVRVDNLSLENVFVPAPYHPRRVHGAAAERMVYSQDGTFIATSDLLGDEPALLPGLTYGVESQVPAATADDLRSVPSRAFDDPAYARWLELPGDYPRLREETAAVLDAAGASTPYEIAFALQDFFRGDGRFSYSTDVPPLRDDGALTRFVTEDRVGYCEYYATAMAVMLRLAGVPSRVAVGFRTGDEIEPGQYVVTTEDAHAWVEALFPGHGWIQFEPTPALGDALVPGREDVTPELPVADADPAQTDRPSPAAEESPGQATASEPAEVPGGLAGGATDGQEAAGGSWALRWLAVALVAVGIVAVAAAGRRRALHRGLPGGAAGRVLAAQRHLYETGRGLGVGRRPAETAREVTRRWSDEGRVEADAAGRFAALAQTAAFGRGVAGDDADEAERLARVLARGLRDSATPSARLTAPVRARLASALDEGRVAVRLIRERAVAVRGDADDPGV